jgi:hypothetical protein
MRHDERFRQMRGELKARHTLILAPHACIAGNIRALQRVDRTVERYGTGNWNYEEFTQE